jgi:ribosomal protein S27E
MQVRCQHCGYTFTLSREAVAAALEEIEQTNARHYGVDCPKCRHQTKVPARNVQRFRSAIAPPAGEEEIREPQVPPGAEGGTARQATSPAPEGRRRTRRRRARRTPRPPS